MPYETKKIILDKAKGLLPRIRNAIYEPIAALTVSAWVTKEPVPYSERTSGAYMDVKPGDKWGNLWDCAWFRFEGCVPESAAGKKVVLLIDVNGELCLVDNEGSPYQGLTNINSEFDFSLGLPGKRVVDVSESAAGESIHLWADAGCNDLFGKYRSGTLKEADIAICNDETRRLYYDFEVLLELAEQVPDASARKDRVIQSLYEAALALEVINEETVARAREILGKQLAKRGGDPTVTVSAIGHAHMDLAWLWPIRETIRKGARTFSTVLRNMEKYPDYVFGASQPQLYQWMKEYYPTLYDQIKERVKEGRWEVQGAMWVEPDTNISGGEALVRQILYGKKFFQDEFGQEMKVLWLPDVFGYNASLPQLLKKSGVDYMMTQKLSWSVYNTHPHHSFHWEGIDGSKVLAHLPPEDTYNSPGAPRSLAKIESHYLDRNVSEHALMLFGIGDGGGGPGEEHLERLAREHNLLGLPPVVQESSLSFFEKLAQEGPRFQTYRGELYLEKHQGTLTSQARNKWYNRKMEKSLRELEFAASLALALGEQAYPSEELDEIWKEVLLYQFHDILPGSSITRVFDESLARYAILHARVAEMVEQTYAKVAGLSGIAGGQAIVVNSLPWEREELVERNGFQYAVKVPSMGFIALSEELRRGGNDNRELHADEASLENRNLRVAFAPDGSILSIYDKVAGRETIEAGKKANVLTIYHDKGDAWDFPRDYRDTIAGTMQLENAAASIQGSNAVLVQTYRFGESSMEQRIVLAEDGTTIQFETKVDWQESEKMLRTSFPVSVMSEQVNCEIQFGYLKRPTTRNTMVEFVRDEICAHQYIDLSQPDYGVALLSDSKYGYSAERNVLDMNLLRSPGYPDPACDRAEHKFVYAIYPHQGDFVQAKVYRKGYELNTPLTVVQSDGTETETGRSDLRSLIQIDNPDVMVEAVKKAEDSEHLIIRLYEASGTRAKANVNFGLTCAAIEETDLLENPITLLQEKSSSAALTFQPFEIKTLRIKLNA